MVQNFLSLLACINHTDVQCVGDNEILVYPENRFYLQHFQMLVYLYFDSNKKYNAVVKIQKEKNQTGPVPIIVSLCNRTAGRRGRQNVCVWQIRQGYNLHVMSWSSLSVNVFLFLQKDLFKGKWRLAKSYFKQNCCHGCHTKFAVFFPLPSCCVSSLIIIGIGPTTNFIISCCELQEIINPQNYYIINQTPTKRKCQMVHVVYNIMHHYLQCVLSFSVPVVVFMSAVLKDF